MKSKGTRVTIILLFFSLWGCKNNSDVLVGTDAITKVAVNNLNSTFYFTESEKPTKYTMVITTAPKEDAFQEMSVKVNFETEEKPKAGTATISMTDDKTHESASTTDTSTGFQKTNDLESEKFFRIPRDVTNERRRGIKIDETKKYAFYKDERVTKEFQIDDYLKVLDNIEPRLKHFAGDISDEDNNGRVIFVFTEFDQKYIGGVFHNTDLKGATHFEKSEILYISARHSQLINFTALAHELQHLINFNYKYIIPGKEKHNNSKSEESFGINEGLSHLIEDLCGYSKTLNRIVELYLDNSATVSLKTDFPDEQNQNAEEESKVRGGNYLFLRYMYEQLGEDNFVIKDKQLQNIEPNKGGDFIRALIQSPEVGYEKIEKLSGKPVAEWLLDWGITLSGKSSDTKQYAYQAPVDDPVTGNKRGVRIYGDNEDNSDEKESSTLKGPKISPLKNEQDFQVPHYGVNLFSFTVPKRTARAMTMNMILKNTNGNVRVAFIPVK